MPVLRRRRPLIKHNKLSFLRDLKFTRQSFSKRETTLFLWKMLSKIKSLDFQNLHFKPLNHQVDILRVILRHNYRKYYITTECISPISGKKEWKLWKICVNSLHYNARGGGGCGHRAVNFCFLKFWIICYTHFFIRTFL